MTYELIFDTVALDALFSLPKNIAKRIWNKLQETKENPHRYFERLTKRSSYKLRVGEYRAIADIDDNQKIISVMFIAHRKNVYRKI